MPFGSTWSEELVAEWMELNNYLTTINVKAGSSQHGGRFQADAIGFKFNEGKPEILHVEVGSLPDNSSKIIERTLKKFSIKDKIEEHFKKIIDFHVCENYRKMYVATYVAEKARKECEEFLKKNDIEFLTFKEFIRIVIDDLKEYHKNNGKDRTLPESLWLLILLDNLNQKSIDVR